MKYCIGDIHGCYKTLKKLISKISKRDSSPEFYFVGDYIDRGKNSKKVLDLLIDLKSIGNLRGAIRGNHEQMFLDAYKSNNKISETIWINNGAIHTIKSFKHNSTKSNAKDCIPEKYFDFIKSLPYFIELEKYFIVHAGFNFSNNSPFEDINSMLWTRKEDYSAHIVENKIIIHGHSPIKLTELEQNLRFKPNNIVNIDTGCVYTQFSGLGYLTALNLTTFELFSVKNCE